jgi:plasmid stability protein
MANLTIRLDDGLLKRARIRAVEDGTSVNALARTYLERYAGVADVDDAQTGLAQFARLTQSAIARGGRTWTRDELHDRTDRR